MKRLCQLAVVIMALFCAGKAHAATCPISSGASFSTISSTITGCASGNTVTFAAGTYSITGSIAVPCGVTLAGPTVNWANPAPYTAILNFTPTNPFTFAACSTARTIHYLTMNGGTPSSTGGEVMYFAAGQSNLTITDNYFYGNNMATTGESFGGAELVYFDGSTSGTVNNSVTVTGNIFGQPTEGACSNLMNNYSYSGLSGDGGYCVGLGMHNNFTNLTVTNNIFQFMEQGMKTFEGTGECVNCLIEFNDFNNIHRINYETQSNTGPSLPVSMTIAYNDIHDQYGGNYGSWGISAANGCTTGCNTVTSDNVLIGNNVNPSGSYIPGAIEVWGSGSATQQNYNLIQGVWGNPIDFSYAGGFVANNNTFCISGTVANTAPPAVTNAGGVYFGNETENSFPNGPATASGNSFTNTATCPKTSVQPTISPASGSFSGSQTVALANGSGATNRDTNTSIWYTTDGSTPVPGSGTAQLYTGSFSVSATTTVKAVGMWGAYNQPRSYPSGYGYVPSAAVSATYTLSTACPGPLGSVLITTYGGAMGDGTTENTTAINNTFNYAKTNGCSVEIPAGTFAHSGVLVANGITVFGLGSGSILKATSAGTSAVELEGTAPSLSNLVILGTGSSRNAGEQQAGVWVNGATGYTVNNVLVNGGSCVGIWNESGSNGTETNNTVENTLADSITNTNGANQILVQNNMVYNSGDDGISNNSYTTDGNTVNHITVNQNAIMRNSFARGLEVSGGSNISFTNNYVDNKSGYACLILASETSSFQTQTVNTVAVTGNTLVNCGPDQGSIFLWPDGSANVLENITLNGNQLYNASGQQTFVDVQVTGTGTISSTTIENTSAYTNPLSFYFSNGTGSVSVTQTSNTLFATSAYPGPIAPPIGGTVPLFSLATGTYTLPQTLTLNEVTSGDTIDYCTVSSGTCTPGTAYSSAITVSAAETVCAVGINSSVSGSPVTSAPICATYNGGGGVAPTLTGGYQGNTGSINALATGAAAIQQTAFGTYSAGGPFTLPDAYGNTAVWSSSNSAVLNVSSTGLVSCIAPGTANSQVSSAPGGVPFSPWGWTCTGAATPAAATPVFSPGSESFSGPIGVSISDSTSGSTIYYTTNGTTPSPGAQYYLSPSGSDSSNGTSPSTPWLTPGHALNCGDVITAAAGSYSNSNFASGKWGTVSCAANNNVAWVKCATFDACKITVPSGGTNPGMYVDNSYWGVQGFEVTVAATPANNGECFLVQPSGAHPVTVHHVIFADNVANGCYYGAFIANSYSTTASVDYFAVVGNIAYNGAQGSSECFSGISVFQPLAYDTNPGTHIYVAGNISYGNYDPATCAGTARTDGEGVTFDTFDHLYDGAAVYLQQGVIENNLLIGNGGNAVVIGNNNSGAGAPIYVEHNTTYGNMQSSTGEYCAGQGELAVTAAFNVTVEDNMAMTSGATGCSGDAIYAASMSTGNVTDTVSGNWLYSAAGNNTFLSASGSFAYGSNTTGTSPAFASTTIPGAPSCSGTASTIACMASTLTGFTPSASGSAAFGYQAPSIAPVTDSLFPTWLCNTRLPGGLISTPCSTSSAVYSGPIPVTTTTTINALATASGYINSAVASATYTASLIYYGVTQENYSGNAAAMSDFPNYFAPDLITVTAPYSVAGGAIYLGNGGTPGDKVDLIIVPSTGWNSESATPVCHATFTETTGTINAWVNMPFSGCTLAAGNYWLGFNTNDPGLGFAVYTCNGTPGPTGACLQGSGNATSPLFGSFYIAQTYGSYTGFGTPLTQLTVQQSQYIYGSLSAATLTGGTLSNGRGISSLAVGATAIPFVATGAYSDSVGRTLPDIYGNTAVWSSSNGTVLNVTSSGQVSCLTTGTANVQVTSSPGSVAFTPYSMTCTSPTTPTSAYQANPGTVSLLTIFSPPVQQHAYCVYPDAVTLDCTTTDARGNAVTAWGEGDFVLSVGAVGSTRPGLVSPATEGTTTSTCTVTGGITCAPYTWTIIFPTRTAMPFSGVTMNGVKTH